MAGTYSPFIKNYFLGKLKNVARKDIYSFSCYSNYSNYNNYSYGDGPGGYRYEDIAYTNYAAYSCMNKQSYKHFEYLSTYCNYSNYSEGPDDGH